MYEHAGRTVRLNDKASDPVLGEVQPGVVFRIEDYWHVVAGATWRDLKNGNPAAWKYSQRVAATDLPIDEDVVYGKIGSFGHLVHVSELGEPID